VGKDVLPTRGYVTKSPSSPLEPFDIERRELGPYDVLVDTLYCGVCHRDIHQARNEWGSSTFPMVRGHEIVGTVVKVGDNVRKWRVGDILGIGCFVDSCRKPVVPYHPKTLFRASLRQKVRL